MSKPQTKKAAKSAAEDIELHPDAWERFEKFVTDKVPTRPVPKAAPSRAKAASRKPRKPA